MSAAGTSRRPGPLPVILLALVAAGMVTSFALGAFNAQWALWIAAFGVMELWAAINRVEGATLSERVWAWIGLRPRRPSRWLRVPICAVFFITLILHFVTTGAYWWSGGPAIIVVAVPFFLVVTYALTFERGVTIVLKEMKEVPVFSSLKSWVIRKFARGPLEKLQKDLAQSQKEGQPMKLSPAVKSVLIFAGVVVLQAGWDYYSTDKTPTANEAMRYVLGAVVASALFWVRSGRLPTPGEVQASLVSGHIEVGNDDPKDPVVIKVDGQVVAQPTTPPVAPQAPQAPKKG